ncbi:MAG: hypothetical protein WC052_04180 [Patescibacteria group bacterium]|jgi:hypothetical protein
MKEQVKKVFMDEKRHTPIDEIEKDLDHAALKEAEHSKMLAYLEKARDLGKFDATNPGIDQSMTPREHLHIGSSVEGLGYHPNLPFGFLGGSSLEVINRVREEMNKDGARRFFCETPEGKPMYVLVEFLPLTEQALLSEEPTVTFKIVGAMSHVDEPMPIPANAEAYLIAKMQKVQIAAKKEPKSYG